MSPEPFLAYDPPYGGQVLRARRVAAAWQRIAEFLARCTDADPHQPEHVALTLSKPATGTPNEWYEPTLRAAEAAFGPGTWRDWIPGVPGDFRVDWRLRPQDAEPARALLTAGEPWPEMDFGTVGLSVTYTFRWVDPETGVVLPGQTEDRRADPVPATSTILVTFGPRAAVFLTGRFPFPVADAAFIAYIECIAPFTPVPLLASRFRHWVPTRRPTQLGYVVRRVSSALLDAIAR